MSAASGGIIRGHFGAQKSCHRVSHTLGTCGAGQVALVRSNPPPVAVPSPQNGKKNCRNFGPAVQPAATLWQVCGAMPATPGAVKSTTDAAGHAEENRNSFINLGFAGLEVHVVGPFERRC